MLDLETNYLDIKKKTSNRNNPELLSILLKDRTTGKNIILAQKTNMIENKSKLTKPIKEKWLHNNDIFQLRVKKTIELQKDRTKTGGEVFTPIWIVNKQVESIERYFSKMDLSDYVKKKWLEITCGEAPYICTRYDVTNGKSISNKNRVGFLDKKLQRISKEIDSKEKWIENVIFAYQASYGYEFQGDSLFIARKNLLQTFFDYYEEKFSEEPDFAVSKEIAKIISHNIFQMDGLNYTISFSEKIEKRNIGTQLNLFGELENDTIISKIVDGEKVKIKDWTISNKNNVLFERVVKNEEESMKFDVVIGNPPYNDEAKQQIYTDFYIQSIKIADYVCLIFPTGWQQPKDANNLRKMNNTEVKRDRQIVYIDNIKGAFQGVAGAENTNIILWKKGYNNELNGKQKFLKNGEEDEVRELYVKKEEIEKPNYINELNNIVMRTEGFTSISSNISSRNPYGLSTDILKNWSKYSLPPLDEERKKISDIKIFTSKGLRYVRDDYPFPQIGKAFEFYKVFVPYAWGNWDEKKGLGGAFSNIFIASPKVACVETYLECGAFHTQEDAYKFAKYLMTQFARGLLYVNKYSQHSTTAFSSIPSQDFTEEWWNLSVKEINEKLFIKYGISKTLSEKINVNIQEKNEENIVLIEEMK